MFYRDVETNYQRFFGSCISWCCLIEFGYFWRLYNDAEMVQKQKMMPVFYVL